MADQKLTDKSALTAVATTDVMHVVDVSDTSADPAGTSKKSTVEDVLAGAGGVTGPGSSTDNALARFDGATGKIIQNSTITLTDAGALSELTLSGGGATVDTISDDDDMGADSATFLATQQSIKAYVDNRVSRAPLWIPGQYYFATDWLGDGTLNLALGAVNRLYASWFEIRETTDVDRLAIAVTTGTGNPGDLARLGIYFNATSGFEPGALLVDGGTVAVDVTANVETTIAETLEPGIYWTVLLANALPSMKHAASTDILPTLGWNNALASKTTQIVRTGFAFGVLPDPFGTVILTTGNIPSVGVRAA